MYINLYLYITYIIYEYVHFIFDIYSNIILKQQVSYKEFFPMSVFPK